MRVTSRFGSLTELLGGVVAPAPSASLCDERAYPTGEPDSTQLTPDKQTTRSALHSINLGEISFRLTCVDVETPIHGKTWVLRIHRLIVAIPGTRHDCQCLGQWLGSTSLLARDANTNAANRQPAALVDKVAKRKTHVHMSVNRRGPPLAKVAMKRTLDDASNGVVSSVAGWVVQLQNTTRPTAV